LRVHQLTVRQRLWAGGRPGLAGSAVHLYPSTILLAALTTATTLPAAITLVNSLISIWNQHVVDTKAHQVAGLPPSISGATDLPTALTAANSLAADYAAHILNANVNWNASSAFTYTGAVDLSTLLVLANLLTTSISAHISASAVIITDFVLPQHYRVRQLTQKEIHQSGGEYEEGYIVVEHVTPFDGVSVGVTVDQIKPHGSNALEIIYLITTDDPGQGHVGEYDLEETRSWRPYSFDLIMKRRATTPTP
jgi:hypothetical protein